MSAGWLSGAPRRSYVPAGAARSPSPARCTEVCVLLLRLCLALPLALALLAPISAPVEAEDVTARQAHRYFEGTGHNVGEPFLSFWDRYGTYSSFGEPMTEAFEEDGRLVQYF